MLGLWPVPGQVYQILRSEEEGKTLGVSGDQQKMGRKQQGAERSQTSLAPSQYCIASIWPGWDGLNDSDIIQKTRDAAQRPPQMRRSCAPKRKSWLSKSHE